MTKGGELIPTLLELPSANGFFLEKDQAPKLRSPLMWFGTILKICKISDKESVWLWLRESQKLQNKPSKPKSVSWKETMSIKTKTFSESVFKQSIEPCYHLDWYLLQSWCGDEPCPIEGPVNIHQISIQKHHSLSWQSGKSLTMPDPKSEVHT